MSKGFDVEKSNVSAEMKALFQQTSTRASKVTAVPGIGGVTADKLKAQGIETVGELVDKVQCFEDLKALVGGVNRHRIFDCLEGYLQEKCKADYEVTEVLARAMEEVGLVDESKDGQLAEEVQHCRVS
jgi:nucleotidyltransferase/DNA polymerase involved in DNA repair|tara:strand:+ start:372 stop:755 length:384 start_codon:yes stop_codon:yes gene_type:complete